MGAFAKLKRGLLLNPVFQQAWRPFREKQLLRAYDKRREYYHRLAAERGLVYEEGRVKEDIRRRLAQRGYTPTLRQAGSIHTFAFVPDLGWHRHLLPDLKELGPVTVFDYAALGYGWEEFYRADRNAWQRRAEMNRQILPALREAHARQPVDWIFVYAQGLELSAATLRQIVEEFGVPVANMCLDDKQSWLGPWMGDHFAGQRDICREFDISWTSARIACEWYLVEGARPVFMPEGFDMLAFRPMDVPKDIPVSFVGSAYGYRPVVACRLRRHGLPVRTFGSGWKNADWVENIVEIFNRSIVNLGCGGIGYTERLTNIKGRDFEIPGTGGGVYLTSFNADLARFFDVGREILCYANENEMIELLWYYLEHPDEALEISLRGRERCLREHRWVHRYERLCQLLGIL